MNMYDVIIYNDVPHPIQKITVRLRAETKEEAREYGESIADKALPFLKTAVEVEFRRQVKGEA